MTKAKKALKLLILSALVILSLGCFATSASAANTEVETLKKGSSYSLTGYYKVKSSNTNVATAKKKSTRNYTITGLKKGKTTLQCYNKNGKLKNTIYLLVTTNNSFVYNTNTCYLAKGKTRTARASTNFHKGVTVKYASSNKKVATVSSSGKITGVKAGTATIKAKFYYKGTKVKTLKKTVHVYTSSYDDSKLTLNVGDKKKVAATVSGNCSVSYSSSKSSVAKVSSKGRITAKKEGSATITCKISVGKTVVKTYKKKVVVKNNIGQQIADYAQNFIGRPYVWGGTDLWNGSDCSGFVMTIYRQYGIYLNHFADDQMKGYGSSVKGTNISPNPSSMLPGDLVFYGEPGYADHVMIYIGNGMVVGARGSAYGVTKEVYNYRTPIAAVRYWDKI